ncbi:UNKNOWN [Stylonychia lemnae]|uniref:RyR/IP3R Homology associated domain-containing protein n=1 Tax=Stylonychia lemnae TaxID=5949 RepID=A0A077ZYI0_STYLE|nr:UNKNOWN [Stylonychia lemnae]|eukprot:CDW74252.1 UNKNOWN [Stylonychia lemnae]
MNSSQERADTSQSQDTPQNKKKIQISQVHHNTLLQNNTDSLFGNNLSNNLAAKKGAGVASEAKKTKISSGVFNNGEDLALQLLIKGDKLSSDPLEEFKIEQSSNLGGASQFSRQLSESNSQRSLNSDDSQPDKLAATVKKQDIQILQNQLDVIEEEVEENGDNQKFSGFNAVKQKVDPKSGQQKDNKTFISGGGLNLNPALKQAQNDIMSLIKGGQSKGDRDSIMGNIGEGGPFISKAQDRRESVSIALNDKKSAINMKEQKLINDSPYQPPMENPYLKDKGLLFEEQLIDNQVQMEKVQLGLMGYHSLIYGNLVSIVIDQNEESFKLLSKKSISKKLSKKQFQEEELDSRCMFRIVPQSQYQAQLKMKMVVQSDVFPLNSIQREYDTLMAEAESNKVFQQQMMGTDVKYWVDIQIVHEHSKRFLCVDHMESSSINQYYDPKTFIDSDLKNITFTTQASKNTHFKLVPTCNFQSEGSGIISNGHYFYIIHTDKDNKDFYLYEHTKTQDFIFSESYKTPFRFSTIRDSISFEEEKCLRNSSNVIVTMANENYFLDLKTVPDLDQSLNKNLAQQIANNDKNQVHVGKVTYALDLERYDDIKSIDLSGFWVVEIQEEHDFRVKLKNMMTGQYLTAQHYDGMTSISMTKEDLPDQEFEIVPVNIRVDETKSIDKQLVFKIRTCPMNIGEYEEPKYLRASNHLHSSPHLQQTIQHIVFDETDHQRQHFILGKECELNKYDTFKFVFPDNDEFLEINICADSMQMLYSVIKSIQKQKGLPSFLQNQENFQLLATSNIMIGLLNYCNNKLEGKILPKQKMGEPVPYRQKLLERIGLLDYLFDYLDLIIDSKIRKPAITIASRKDQKQWETQIHQVFQLRNKGADTEYMGSLLEIIFELIYSIVQNQRSFKYDASQKIDILQKFIFVENAPKVLIEILREELGQLAKKEIHAISEPVKIYQFQKYIPLLDFFLQSLDPKNRKKRYIFLMRKICIQDGYPLPLVQEYIYNQLFKDTSNRGKILDIQVAGNGFNIYDEATQKSYEFFDFERPHFEQSPKYQQYLYRDPKFDKIKEFLLEEMDLLSDICQVRAKFVRLLVVLYIDCEPHQEVQYSRILSYVEGSQRTFSLFDNQQRQIANMNQKFEEIYTFINDQLPQGSQIEEISQFEMQILYLCQNLLRFGLFTFEEGSSIKTVNIIKLSDYLFSMLQRISEKSSQQNILSDIEKFLILSLTQSGGTNENSLFTEKNLSVGNPVDRSSLDVKYLLFNKKQWNLMSDNVANNSKIMANLRTNLSNKIQQDKYYFNLQRIHKFFIFSQIALINIKNRIQAIVPKNYGQGKSYDSKLLKFQSISELFDGFKQRNRDIFKQVKTKTIISRKDREFVFQEAQLINFQQKYSSFTDIVIEVFNNCQEDEYLQQMSLSLISRFNSENGEFKLQRSNLWPMIDNAIPQKEYDELIAQLKKFKKLFYFEHRTLDRTKADFEIIDTNKKRRIFKLHQNIFRCLKGYDIILNYIQLNKNNFYNIQKRLQSITNNWGSGKGLSDIKINNIKMVQRIYKKCFSVLDAFTKNNKKCKKTIIRLNMPEIWIHQYKNSIKESTQIKRILQSFWVFMEIQLLIMIYPMDKEQDPNIFETGITVLEILSYIVQGDTTAYKNSTLAQMQKYVQNETYSEEKVEIFREKFLENIAIIYNQIYFMRKDYELYQYRQIQDFILSKLYEDMQKQCNRYKEYLLSQEFEEEKSNLSIAELKFILHHTQKYFLIPAKKIQRDYQIYNESDNKVLKGISTGLMSKLVSQIDQIGLIERNVQELKEIVMTKSNGTNELKNLLKYLDNHPIAFDIDQYPETDRGGPYESNEYFAGSNIFKRSQLFTTVGQKQTMNLDRFVKVNVKQMFLDKQTKNIKDLWKQTVEFLSKTDQFRKIIIWEQQEFGRFLYGSIMNSQFKQNGNFQDKELKFIYNCIQYIEKCDKMPWVVYNIQFLLKSLSINPASQQQRFLAYFKNDKQSEYFFKYIYTSFQNSIEKINKKYVIEKFKGRQSLGSISNKIYYNTNPSSEMKNILRKQPQNNRSYNIVLVVYKYFCSLLRHLDTPIVYNLVKSSLEFLNLMIQGLNFENQKILLDNGFFQIAKELLEIDYHYEMSDSQRIKLQKDNQAFEKYFKFRQYFQMDNRQISKLKLLVIPYQYNAMLGDNYCEKLTFKTSCRQKIMTECGYFFKNYHNNIYHHNVLFVNYNNKYQYMIEIAFYSYFILKKIQHSIRYDKDDYFYKNLLYLMPEQQVYRQNKIVLIEKARQFFLGYFLFVWEMFDLLLQYFRKLINQKIPITEFQTDDQIRETFEFLDRHIGKVELVRSSGSLHTVQFIKLPYCQFKTDVEKDSFLNKVDRTNTQTKVEGLMKVHRNFIRQFKQDQNIQSIPILGQMSKYQETWAISSFVLSFIINIFILFSFYKDKKNSTTSGSSSVQVISTSKKLFGAADSDVSDSVINTCGILILCNCLFILILHGYGKIPIHFDVAFHPEKYKPRSKSGLIYHQHLQAGINQKKKRIARIKDGGKKMFKFLRLVTSDFPLMYHLMCVIFAFLGVTVHFFYFAFHLSYFIISSQTLFNVLRSIWEPKYKIFMTLILFLLIEYLFVIISFQTYRDYFPADNCENLLRCYLVTLDQTFKASGGVGGFLNSAYLSSESGSVDPNYIDYGRLLYDFFFNFILIILIIQMISGIIIDKFGALREQDDNIDRDSKTCCFICGQSKESIDKMYDGVGGFYSHISFDHNMWNYIYYCAYLYEKKKNTPKDLRDSEKEIIQKLENYDNSWLPAYYNYSEL